MTNNNEKKKYIIKFEKLPNYQEIKRVCGDWIWPYRIVSLEEVKK